MDQSSLQDSPGVEMSHFRSAVLQLNIVRVALLRVVPRKLADHPDTVSVMFYIVPLLPNTNLVCGCYAF